MCPVDSGLSRYARTPFRYPRLSRVANSVGYLSGILLKALEVDTLERRVSDLEIATKNPPQSDSLFDPEGFQPPFPELASRG
jgi:hypothetical protein